MKNDFKLTIHKVIIYFIQFGTEDEQENTKCMLIIYGQTAN